MYEESVAPAMHIQPQQSCGDANNSQYSKSYREDETPQSSGGLSLDDTMLLPVIHLRDETIAAAGQRFDETGIFCRVSQHVAQLLDSAVQPIIEVNKSVSRPEFATEFLARNHVTWMLKQKLEHLEGLVLKPQADAVFAHLTRMQVHVEGAEAQPTGWSSTFHSRFSTVPVVYHRQLIVKGVWRSKCQCRATPLNSRNCTIRTKTSRKHAPAIGAVNNLAPL